MPGRFRTASRPFKTLILLESYTSFADMQNLAGAAAKYSIQGLRTPVWGRPRRLPVVASSGVLAAFQRVAAALRGLP
jgi:hypothetical protein